MEFPEGLPIQNVVGSSRDRYINGYRGWLDLWKNVTGIPDAIQCSTCRNLATVGGHVVVGRDTETRQPQGSNRVFILPLCSACNRIDSVMHLVRPEKAVHLVKYKSDVLPNDRRCSRRGLNRLYESFYDRCAFLMARACLNRYDEMLIHRQHGEGQLHNFRAAYYRNIFNGNITAPHNRMVQPAPRSRRSCKSRNCRIYYRR